MTQTGRVDPMVRAAMLKWPNVPDVYGWLRLDARGRWQIRNSQVNQPALEAFINRNYLSDTSGRWFFQNGPQRVFVTLDLTPWVLRLSPDGTLSGHTGTPWAAVDAVWLDDAGHLLVSSPAGLGLIHDADLAAASARLAWRDGAPATLESLLASDAPPPDIGIQLATGWHPIAATEARTLGTRFGFVAEPKPSGLEATQPRP